MAYRTPGRFNLIAEHTEYNRGFVLLVALDRDAVPSARSRTDSVVILRNVEEQYPPVTFEVEHVPYAGDVPAVGRLLDEAG